MIMNKDLSTPADTPGTALHLRRKQLLDQVLDRTSLQILLIHLQLCVNMINVNKEKKQIRQSSFSAVFSKRWKGTSRMLQGKWNNMSSGKSSF